MLNGWKATWTVDERGKKEESDKWWQFNNVFGPKKEPQDMDMKTICLRGSPDPMDVKEMLIQVSEIVADVLRAHLAAFFVTGPYTLQNKATPIRYECEGRYTILGNR